MTCCSHIQHILKHEFPFINGLYCILDKKCKFFSTIFCKFKAPLHQSLFNTTFSVGKGSWNITFMYKNKIKNMHDTRISEFNYNS